MSMLKGAAVIGQSGGPSSVINASAYGAIKTALESDVITNVYAMQNGIVGLLNDNLFDLAKEDPDELALMKYTPSSALGSCRYKLKDPDEDETDYQNAFSPCSRSTTFATSSTTAATTPWIPATRSPSSC